MKASLISLLMITAISCACGGANSYSDTVQASEAPESEAAAGRCEPEPSSKNTVVPFFDKIFDGKFQVINHFDHDAPIWPARGNGFQIDWCGKRRTKEIDGHTGYDFRMDEGVTLYAPADGSVNWAGEEDPFYCSLLDSEIEDQLRVEITHKLPDGRRITSNFKHLSRVDVRVGQRVRAGTVIGLSGNTGCSLEPHLHFETWLIDGTKTRRSVLFDAFGWEGEKNDPWAEKPNGARSIWLWKPGKAPDIFK